MTSSLFTLRCVALIRFSALCLASSCCIRWIFPVNAVSGFALLADGLPFCAAAVPAVFVTTFFCVPPTPRGEEWETRVGVRVARKASASSSRSWRSLFSAADSPPYDMILFR